MDAATFAAECRRLTRPRFDLRPTQSGDVIVGVWGGSGPLTPPSGDWEHWITISCDGMSRNGFGLSGRLGVYENRAPGHFHEFTVVNDETIGQDFIGADGVLLAGREDVSLPPLEALETYGSPEMQSLVRQSHKGTVLETYSDECPLYRVKAEHIYASVGGWHIPWPENDRYDDEPGRLVLWTFQDAEPWLEVWQRPTGQLDVIPRIS